MHWASHCKAFYAQWIVRFLSPRRAPWKSILSHWIADKYIGDAILLSSARDGSSTKDVTKTAPYARACLKAFAELDIHDTTRRVDQKPHTWGVMGLMRVMGVMGAGPGG